MQFSVGRRFWGYRLNSEQRAFLVEMKSADESLSGVF